MSQIFLMNFGQLADVLLEGCSDEAIPGLGEGHGAAKGTFLIALVNCMIQANELSAD